MLAQAINNNNYYAFQHRLGACDDSLCLKGRFILSVMMGTSNVETVSIRQQNIVPEFSGPTNNTSTFDLSIQHFLRQASIRHSTNIAIPPKSLAPQLRLNRKCLAPSQDLNVGHTLCP